MKKCFFILFLLVFILAERSYSISDLSMGYQYLNEGNPASALTCFSQAVSSGDNDLYEYAVYGSARAKFNLGNYTEAADDFKIVVKQFEESAILEEANYYLAKCYAKTKNFQEASKQIEKYLTDYEDGNYADELSFLNARLLESQKDYRMAYRAYSDVDLYYPLSSYAKKARIQMRALSKKHKISAYKPDPKKLYAKGEEYFVKGDYKTAAAFFSKLARDYPKHKLTSKAYLMLGRAEIEEGDEKASIKNIEKSLKLSTGSQQGRSLYYLGRTYGRRGRYSMAISAMAKVVKNFPKSSYADDALYYLSVYYEKTDSPSAALSSYVNLIISHPNSKYANDAILRAGYLYSQNGEYENAFKVYSLAKKYRANSETPQCLFLWGLTAEKLGKIDNAAGIYYYVAENYDHTFQGYRAKEKLSKLGYVRPLEKLSLSSSINTSEIDEGNVDDVMETWKKKNSKLLGTKYVEDRLTKYSKLLDDGLTEFAFLEAKELLSKTEGETKESAQHSLAKIMQKSGEYSIPIRYTENKIKNAIWNGSTVSIPAETWQLAYPKGFWRNVYESSNKNGIDPYLTLAVIREESRFNVKALSRARAHGLMQIIPSTGKILARQLDIESFKNSKMYSPSTNIEMGTYYLSNLIKRFDGNVALALAGYNGGPARVKKWVNNWYNGDNAGLDVDEFIQNIPIRETRNYVQKVLGSYYEYKRIYDGRRD